MERQELEELGYWEKQVACSKLWAELATPIFTPRDRTGRLPQQTQVRRTIWEGWWLYKDNDGYQLLEDADDERWVLTPTSR